MKVIDVSIQVTCAAEDVETVRNSLNTWYCENETALIQRPKTGGIKTSKPRAMTAWMRETLWPEYLESK